MRIGIYAGSFNPLHIGHVNIIQKASRLFDKLIIAQGINPEKNNEQWERDPRITHQYDGLLTDFINRIESEYGYEVTLVRGLRNSTDLKYEETQLAFLRDFKPDLQVIYIPCDTEFKHISSSAIRMLSHYGKRMYLPPNENTSTEN